VARRKIQYEVLSPCLDHQASERFKNFPLLPDHIWDLETKRVVGADFAGLPIWLQKKLSSTNASSVLTKQHFASLSSDSDMRGNL